MFNGFMIHILLLIGSITLVSSLVPADNFREGSCSGLRANPLKHLNRPLLDSLTFMTAGSRYHLYRAASADPEYRQIREDEFFYDSCLQRKAENGVGTLFIFGRTSVEFDLRTRPERPDIYFEAISRNPLAQWDFARAQVTLTDNKSFAFIVNCWTGVDQRAWNVLSNVPSLEEETIKQIEDHAVTLGFDKAHFVFLRQDKCNRINPLVPAQHESRVKGLGRRLQLTRVNAKPFPITSPILPGGGGGIIDGDEFVARRASTKNSNWDDTSESESQVQPNNLPGENGWSY